MTTGTVLRRGLISSALILSLLGQAAAQEAPPTLPGKTDADKAHARDAFRRAKHAYDFGEYAKALDAFKEAYTAYEDPGFLFNIAQCHRQLGQTEEALRVYRSYLRNASNPANADEVRKLIAGLEQTLEAEKRDRRSPPEGTLGPSPPGGTAPVVTPPPPSEPPAVTPAPAASNTLVATRPEKPLVKKPWFWAVVGGAVVVVGAAVVVGVVVGTRSPASNPVPTITTINGN